MRLVGKDGVKVMLFNDSSWKRCDIQIRMPRIYDKLFSIVTGLGVGCKLGYLARIVALDMSYDRVYAVLQLAAPYELYLSHRRRFEKSLGDLIAGIDVNADRINLAIIDRREILRDI